MCKLPLIFVLLSGLALAERVDYIAATVGRKVITASTVRQQLRVAALLDGKPVDESVAARDAIRESLIDRTLILEEMRVSRYAIPEATEIQGALEAEIKEAGGAVGWAEKLRQYRVTEEAVRLSLRYQAAILRFTVYRFRPAVQVTAAQIQAYYDKRWPAGAKPPLEEVRDQIEQLLRLEEINVLLGRWIGEVRQQTHIETYEEKQP
jgi:hypothetical protein